MASNGLADADSLGLVLVFREGCQRLVKLHIKDRLELRIERDQDFVRGRSRGCVLRRQS
jgi:hypothetical protein